jgi:hypothetical protein
MTTVNGLRAPATTASKLLPAPGDLGPANSCRTLPDECTKSRWERLGSERKADLALEPRGGKEARQSSGVDQDVVMTLVVPTPRAVFVRDERRHLPDVPIR